MLLELPKCPAGCSAEGETSGKHNWGQNEVVLKQRKLFNSSPALWSGAIGRRLRIGLVATWPLADQSIKQSYAQSLHISQRVVIQACWKQEATLNWSSCHNLPETQSQQRHWKQETSIEQGTALRNCGIIGHGQYDENERTAAYRKHAKLWARCMGGDVTYEVARKRKTGCSWCDWHVGTDSRVSSSCCTHGIEVKFAQCRCYILTRHVDLLG